MLNQKDGFERDKRSARDEAHSCAGFSAWSWASPSADTCGTWQPVIVSWCGTSPVHLVALGISCVLLVTCCSWCLTPAGHVSLCPPLSLLSPGRAWAQPWGRSAYEQRPWGLAGSTRPCWDLPFPIGFLRCISQRTGHFEHEGKGTSVKGGKTKKRWKKASRSICCCLCLSIPSPCTMSRTRWVCTCRLFTHYDHPAPGAIIQREVALEKCPTGQE